MTTVWIGQTVTLASEWLAYVGGPHADLDATPTVTITPVGGGAPVVGPTTTGVTHPATGVYAYDWDTSGQPAGGYVVQWDGLFGSSPVSAVEVVTVSAGSPPDVVDHFDRHWWYPDGSIAANQRAAVFNADAGTFAVIFADAGMTMPLPNPTQTDANGHLEFWAADGTYWVFVGPEGTGDSVRVDIGPPPPSGAVTSVNGQSGDVVLGASDVGAQPIGVIDAKGDLYVGTGNDATTRLPTGSNGQVLTANAATTSGLEWAAPPSAPVTSVNGEVGVVVLDASDVGADPAGTAATAVSNHNADTTMVHGIADTSDLVLDSDSRLSDARTPLSHASTHGALGSDPITIDNTQVIGLGTAATANTGTGPTEVILGNDSRLSDARTPTAHASTHEEGGADELELSQDQITNLTTDLSNKQDADADLTDIAALSPSNDDVLQRKAGEWTNSPMSTLKTDLALTASDVGLGNVDNTSDANKPVSTAQVTAIQGVFARTSSSFGGPTNVNLAAANEYNAWRQMDASVSAFTGTTTITLQTTNAQDGDVRSIRLAVDAGAGTIEFRNATAGGTLLGTLPAGGGNFKIFTTYTGSAWQPVLILREDAQAQINGIFSRTTAAVAAAGNTTLSPANADNRFRHFDITVAAFAGTATLALSTTGTQTGDVRWMRLVVDPGAGTVEFRNNTAGGTLLGTLPPGGGTFWVTTIRTGSAWNSVLIVREDIQTQVDDLEDAVVALDTEIDLVAATVEDASIRTIVFADDRNVLTVGAGDARWYNHEGSDLEILGSWASAGIIPTDSDLVLDVNIDGTTIYTTQANRPTVDDGTNGGDLTPPPDVAILPEGSYLSVDVDELGATINGGRLTVGVVARRIAGS